MTQEILVKETIGEAIERVLVVGDLARLTPDERVSYYRALCSSVGLNPLTKPFEFITLNGKLTLYARKDATDQLRANNQVSITIVAREVVEGCYVVTARATLPSGRTDESIGACPIEGLKGEARANCLMKVETKAKRRVTLSICGMGLLDETEVETIPGARVAAETKLTDAPRTFGAPKEAAAGTGAVVKEGGPALSGESVGTDSKAAPTFSDDTPTLMEMSTLDQQKKFAMLFRDALPEKLRPQAEALRRMALNEEGYSSSKDVPRKDFERLANKLIRVAKTMEPFIPNDDDLPSNI